MHASDETAIEQVAPQTHDADLSDAALDRAPGKAGATIPLSGIAGG